MEKWLSNLSLASIIRVLTSHKYTIHSGCKYKGWTEKEIINAISKGIHKSLGEDTAILLFETMRNVNKLNQDVIISRPIVFEGILKRFMGKETAVPVIQFIREEFIKEAILPE